ncbi:MAG: glycosyl transferase, partial [Oxalobacteraceae bacterium]
MSIADPRDEEERFLRGLGLSKLFIAQMRLRAERNGTTIETELLASGNVQEAVYYASLAKVLGLYFVEDIDPTFVADSDVLDSQLRRPSILRLTPPHGSSLSVIVPQAGHVAEWRRRLEQSAELRDRVAVTTPSALRRAVWQAGAPRRAAGAADALFDASPELSARSVLTGGQGFLAGFLLAFYASLFAVFPQGTMHASHIGLTSSFFVLILLRGFAVRWGAVRASKVELAVDFRLPVYTVLVAVYQEKEVAEQLVAALLRLDWPHSRLDIKLICEARDPETIQAFSSMNLPPHFEIVAVPDLAPRTKPKALNYGLAGARGVCRHLRR